MQNAKFKMQNYRNGVAIIENKIIRFVVSNFYLNLFLISDFKQDER